MSDHTVGGHDDSHGTSHGHRTPRAEFYVYFALIFMVAIPFAAIAWVIALVRDRHLPVHGPLARAWREAGAITPAIFRP
ncbi:cytochrome PufQ [Tabrizicola sp.]|uniref:cytochrome PufQ n=1 Tax=Tabrizicola sp. TaxID=2005166 RepID=UPI0026199B4E|nr:cytochrome PufQ [Tabrizicola sp.]MDM7930595.1 cytochrome PufQ [Tabrizicola sp.]